jgi:hypothetical protein
MFMSRNSGKLDISYDYKNLWENQILFINDLKSISITMQRILIDMEEFKSGYHSIKEGTTPKLIKDLEEYIKSENKFSKYFTKKYWVNRSLIKKVCQKWDGTTKQFEHYLKYLNCFEELMHIVSKIRCNIYLESNNHEYIIDYIYKIQVDIENIYDLFQDAKQTLTEKHYQEAIQSFYSYKNIIQLIKEISETINQIEECDQNIKNGTNYLIISSLIKYN